MVSRRLDFSALTVVANDFRDAPLEVPLCFHWTKASHLQNLGNKTVFGNISYSDSNFLEHRISFNMTYRMPIIQRLPFHLGLIIKNNYYSTEKVFTRINKKCKHILELD